MRTPQAYIRPRVAPSVCALLFLSLMVVISACGAPSPVREQASQSRAQFDQLIRYALMTGVSASELQPLLRQDRALKRLSAPFALANDQALTAYYRGQITGYERLNVEAQRVIADSTTRARSQAQGDIGQFQLALSMKKKLGLPVQQFERLLSQLRVSLDKARLPTDFALISKKAREAVIALDLLSTTFNRLTAFDKIIEQALASSVDLTALRTMLQLDWRTLARLTTQAELQLFSGLINVQNQQYATLTVLAVPYTTAQQLNRLEGLVFLYEKEGGERAKVRMFERWLDADKSTQSRARTMQDYQNFAKKLGSDLGVVEPTYLRMNYGKLISQFHKQSEHWGKTHSYLNAYDGQKYPINSGYLEPGVGEDLDRLLAKARTVEELSVTLEAYNKASFLFKLFQTNATDKTPYDRVHATDKQLFEKFHLNTKKVLVVSLSEQAMRVYQNGKLVRAFLVTTGRPELPAVPGVWPVLSRVSPTIFKSHLPQSSPYWYPDTPIHYAIMYHEGGYFLHDSWWRVDYGPGTQFPHADSGGNQSFAGNGSHGCINLSEEHAAWVYNNTDWNTVFAIY